MRSWRLLWFGLVWSGACATGDKGSDTGAAPSGVGDGADGGGDGDTGDGSDPVTGPGDGPTGYVGSPCDTDADCPYPGGQCLVDALGFPYGTCSAPCELYCDDLDGHPVTFCVDGDVLPPDAPAALDSLGGCLSRCDLGYFPGTGCRPGYGCAVVPRAGEPETVTYACIPGADSALGSCYQELSARGVAFEPVIRAPEHPDGDVSATCEIADALYLRGPIAGVEIVYYTDTDPHDRVLAACDMAHALVDTMADAAAHGATVLRHLGTYSCRTISGSSSLSRHAFADALDVYGFDFDSGEPLTLVDDWEHDTTEFETWGAAWLYDAAMRWHTDEIWNIILTPNYDAAHDNHFHVDLTPGSAYIGRTGDRGGPDADAPWTRSDLGGAASTLGHDCGGPGLPGSISGR